MIEIIWSNIWLSLLTSRSEAYEEQGIIDQCYAQIMGWA